MPPVLAPCRRTLLGQAAALILLPIAVARADQTASRHLDFEVWRSGRRIGRHTVSVAGGDQDFVVSINAEMAISLGPISLFRYHHVATETWRGGRFAALNSASITNGHREQVSAALTPAGVFIKTLTGSHTLTAEAMPLTHWNQHALQGPLFNPQTGAPMRETVSRQFGQTLRMNDARAVTATRYALSGDAEIVDWYDQAGAWAALRGKVKDGSFIDYHRVS